MCELIPDPLDPLFLLAPPVLGGIAVLLGFGSIRVLARSGTFAARRLLGFLFIFITGELYIIFWQEQIGKLLHWDSAWILLILFWFVGLAFEFWRGRRQSISEEAPRGHHEGNGISAVLVFLALLFCLIATSVELELTLKGQGHIAVALIWVVASIFGIVRTWRNKKTIVVLVLRTMFVLILLGAIAQRSIAAGITLLVIGGILALAERSNTAPRQTQPPDLPNG
jgi:hypothetical protein